jgi:hypothetical protein
MVLIRIRRLGLLALRAGKKLDYYRSEKRLPPTSHNTPNDMPWIGASSRFNLIKKMESDKSYEM